MKHPGRSVLPLPRYTRREFLKGAQAWAYYFKPPSWARTLREGDDRGECPVGPEALGTDYAAAVARAENVLLPLFDSWRTRGTIDLAPETAPRGSFDWLLHVYRDSDEYKTLSRKQRRVHETGFSMVANYVLKDGRRIGALWLSLIDKTVTKPLYASLARYFETDELGHPVRDKAGNLKFEPARDEDGKPLTDEEGAPIFLERRTTANHAMKSCRRAWNVAMDTHPKEVPAVNPFARLLLRSIERETPTADYEDLLAFIAEADARGLASMAAAVLVTWEWLQREEHIFTKFKLEHYRPKHRPDEVLIVHPKNGGDHWLPLFRLDKRTGEKIALFPELMARMDTLKRDRVGKDLFFVRDWIDPRAKTPVPWAPRSGDISYASRRAKQLIRAARLDEALSFTSFRHGGMTELGDAELTDAQIRAISRHKSSKVVGRYVKRTQRQIIAGVEKRRALRPAPAAIDTTVQLQLFRDKGKR